MKAIVFDAPGAPDVLRWDEVPEPDCPPGHLVLDVAASAVNRADLMQREGKYPPPPGASPILGLEAAGHVARVGEGVQGWRVGDRAMALLGGGGYAERVAVDARHVMPVPGAVGLPEAAAVPEVFITVWLKVFELGRLREGERILIHGGGSGIGTAAIQLAAGTGAEVWVTAGSADKIHGCLELGATRGINYRDEEFAGALQEAGGADLILDCVGGKYLERNLKSLKHDGRLVVLGLMGGAKAELNLGLVLRRRLQIIGSTLRARSADDKARLVREVSDHVWPLLDEGKVRPVIDRRVPLAEAARAHSVMEKSEHFGKILLVR